MSEPVALMTAIFGGIDERKEVPEQNYKYYTEYFYDDSSGDLSRSKLSDRTKALFFKAQGHCLVDEEIIIWVDGKIQINSNDFIQQCVDALGSNHIAIMKHLFRKCIYEEVDHIEHCIRNGNEYLATRYAHRPIRKQVEYYRGFGYPVNNGLNDCCIICRRNDPMTNMIFDQWWQECKREYFDQTSIQFQAWRYNVPIQPIVFKPESFTDIPHKVLK